MQGKRQSRGICRSGCYVPQFLRVIWRISSAFPWRGLSGDCRQFREDPSLCGFVSHPCCCSHPVTRRKSDCWMFSDRGCTAASPLFYWFASSPCILPFHFLDTIHVPIMCIILPVGTASCSFVRVTLRPDTPLWYSPAIDAITCIHPVMTCILILLATCRPSQATGTLAIITDVSSLQRRPGADAQTPRYNIFSRPATTSYASAIATHTTDRSSRTDPHPFYSAPRVAS
jgi:hypothetical protein